MNPALKTRVHGDERALVFVFADCGDGKPASVRWAKVYDMSSRRLVCAVARTDFSQPMLEGSWTYGKPVPRYELEGCARLKPGKYQIHSRGAGTGLLDFKVRSDGSVGVLGELCAGTTMPVR